MSCEEFKKRIDAAVKKNSRKYIKKARTTKRTKNQKPEKQVEKYCLVWLRKNGFDVDIIEAGGGFNAYGAVTVKSGYVDCSGNDRHGYAVYIEFKAPKRLSTLRENQRDFLERKINSGAFACVVDSACLLEDIYAEWFNTDLPEKKNYLLSKLPRRKTRTDDFF